MLALTIMGKDSAMLMAGKESLEMTKADLLYLNAAIVSTLLHMEGKPMAVGRSSPFAVLDATSREISPLAECPAIA